MNIKLYTFVDHKKVNTQVRRDNFPNNQYFNILLRK